VPNVIKIGRTVAEICRFNGFFKMAAVRHMGFVGRLLVSIVLPNLVKINAVDLTTGNVQYFASLTSKRLFTTQKLGV